MKKIKDYLRRQGKLKIIKEISGGMNAYAYHCKHRQLGDDRFVKVCHYYAEFEDELLREPRCLNDTLKSNTNTNNLVRFYDAEIMEIEGDKYLCIQMEFVDGPNLLTKIVDAPLGMNDSLIMAAKILNGLAPLHNVRLVHRDIKPSNIMWNDGELKVTDFGSVALLPEGKSNVKFSQKSFPYMPPEGLDIPSLYNITSDIYQVGMVLYEMVNGPLFQREEHYLTRRAKRELLDAGTQFADLNRPDQCDVLNSCIAERAGHQKLLTHGRPPKPYLSRKVVRIINKATTPCCVDRYPASADFLSDIGSISCPNWKEIDKDEFEAEQWQNRDWHVYKNKKSAMLRSKPAGGRRYRKELSEQDLTLKDAFNYVNTL